MSRRVLRVCATSSHKSPNCPGGGWGLCGSNTFPDGTLPTCRSPLGVYDLNGNAAEHMNLPLDPSQMASRGSTSLGYTEMKGSWFVLDDIRALLLNLVVNGMDAMASVDESERRLAILGQPAQARPTRCSRR